MNIALVLNPLPQRVIAALEPCALLLVAGLVTSSCTTDIARLPTAPFELDSTVANATSSLTPLSRQLAGLAVDEELAWNAVTTDAKTPVLQQTPALNQESKETPHTSSLLSLSAVNAPLDALLFTLADEASIQLQLVGSLAEKITLKVVDKPLEHLLNQLSAQSDFSWQLDQQVLTVWSGEPYGFSYSIDYLNMDRRTQSSVGLATQVGTINAVDSASGSIANSSQTRVENVSEHDFWQSLKTDIDGIISHDPARGKKGKSGEQNAQYSINPEAGLLTLHAMPGVHQALRRYLAKLHDSTRRQVLIEATVVEVALSDSFEAGVDWQVLAAGVNGISAAQNLVGAPVVSAGNIARVVAPAGLFSLVQQGSQGDVRATLSLLEQFGDVRILSRPRIIALNNQSSVLKVVDNRVYFTVNIERRQSESRDEVVTETQIHTVPVGLVMNVTPQISAGGAVMLNVRPTLSRILGFVNDPNPELAQANVRNGVPEIQVRELESMLQVQSGNVAIIGGLMQETTEGNDSRLPGLGRLPVLGRLFSQSARKRRQTELLIVLKPTVMQADEHTFNR